MIAAAVFIACAVASALCVVLLVRGWFATRSRLLLWSSLGFAGLALNNIILMLDRLVILGVDLALPRAVAAFIGVLILLIGCIWDAD